MLFETKQLFNQYRDYYQNNGEDGINYIHFVNDEKSPYINGGQMFAQGDCCISIIDNYDGRQPRVFNYEHTINLKNLEYKVKPLIHLDLNIMGMITDYLTNKGKKLSHDLFAVTESLLLYLIENDFDLDMSFYYIETQNKTADELLDNYALSSAKSLITYYSLDRETFLKSKQIVINNDRLASYVGDVEYLKSVDTNCIDKIAGLLLTEQKGQKNRYESIYLVSYVTLMKIVLIDMENQTSIYNKCMLLEEFFENVLNVYMGRELFVGLYYFSEKVKKIIKASKEHTYKNAIKSIRNTAWDITLLRIPELILMNTSIDFLFLPYVCTADKTLARIGEMTKIEMIKNSKIKNYPAALSNDTTNIIDDLGEEIIFILNETDARMHKRMMRPNYQNIKGLELENLKSIEKELELELRSVLK